MQGIMSEYRLREEVQRRGFALGHHQFDGYVDAGLIPPPDAQGRWQPDVVEMLVALREVSDTVRMLPRRLLYFSADPRFAHITADRVYVATLAFAPTMDHATAKTRLVDAALRPDLPLPPDLVNALPPPTPTGCQAALRSMQPYFAPRIEDFRGDTARLVSVLWEGEPLPYEERFTIAAGVHLYWLEHAMLLYVWLMGEPERDVLLRTLEAAVGTLPVSPPPVPVNRNAKLFPRGWR